MRSKCRQFYYIAGSIQLIIGNIGNIITVGSGVLLIVFTTLQIMTSLFVLGTIFLGRVRKDILV